MNDYELAEPNNGIASEVKFQDGTSGFYMFLSEDYNDTTNGTNSLNRVMIPANKLKVFYGYLLKASFFSRKKGIEYSYDKQYYNYKLRQRCFIVSKEVEFIQSSLIKSIRELEDRDIIAEDEPSAKMALSASLDGLYKEVFL